jgi:hypothetical protein
MKEKETKRRKLEIVISNYFRNIAKTVSNFETIFEVNIYIEFRYNIK